MMRSAIRTQVGIYFAAPFAFAMVHDCFGLALVGFLALVLGSSSYVAIVAAVIGGTAVLLGIYYLLTCHECQRVLLAKDGRCVTAIKARFVPIAKACGH